MHTFWWPQKAARGQVGEVRVMGREILARAAGKLASNPKSAAAEQAASGRR